MHQPLEKERTDKRFAALKTALGRPEAAIAILLIFYGVGITGVALRIHEDFLLLTPLNLLLSLALTLAHHPDWSWKTAFFLGLCYVVGFGAELFGIQTGLLFGDYAYGPVLGPQVLGTPLMIGINWMLLAYAAGVTANHLLPGRHWALRALLGALLMVLLDWFIEPVAIRYDFWSWTEGTPPLQNYLGWFLVALPLLAVFAELQAHIRNKVAVALLLIQLVFFLTLGIL